MKEWQQKAHCESRDTSLREVRRRIALVAGRRLVTRLFLDREGKYTITVECEGTTGKREESLRAFTELGVFAEALYRIFSEHVVMPEHIWDVCRDLFAFIYPENQENA